MLHIGKMKLQSAQTTYESNIQINTKKLQGASKTQLLLPLPCEKHRYWSGELKVMTTITITLIDSIVCVFGTMHFLQLFPAE